MTEFLTFVVLGLATGSLYGLTAMGLVLTYKTSGVFNFAHGATGAAAAYLYYQLRILDGVPSPLALVLCLGIAAPIAGLLLERMGRALADASTVTKVVATIGLALAIQGLLTVHYGSTSLAFPNVLPSATVKLGSVYLGYDQIISFVLALLASIGLFVFFRFSPLGVQMRAVVDDPDLLALAGTNATRVRGTAWILGSVFAATSGILLAPTTGLDATLLTLIVLQAFGAAAIGTFSNLPMSYAGGLIVGLLVYLSQGYLTKYSALQGLPASVPFLVLFFVLLVVPAKKLVESGRARTRADAESRIPERVRLVFGAGFIGLTLVVPALVGTRLPVYSDALCFVVIFGSLNLLVRTSGQVSLCAAGLTAVGASSFAHFAGIHHFPWLVAVLLAGAVTVPVGALIALPAIRLSGLYLALATFGFGVLLEKIAYPSRFMFGQALSLNAPRPAGFRGDTAFYYVLLALTLASCGVIGVINRTRLGRLLRGMSDSPMALKTLGLSVNATRVIVFCVASFLAGIGGAMLAARGQSVNGIPYLSFNSLVFLAVLAISGRGRQSAAVIAAISLEVVPSFSTDAKIGALFTPVFGICALVSALAANRRRPESAGAGPAEVRPAGWDRSSLRLAGGPVGARVRRPAPVLVGSPR